MSPGNGVPGGGTILAVVIMVSTILPGCEFFAESRPLDEREEMPGVHPLGDGISPPYQILFIGDTQSYIDPFERNVRSMHAIAPRAVAAFNLGDLTGTGSESNWWYHDDILRKGAPGEGNAAPGWFRADMQEANPEAYTVYLGVMGNHDVFDDEWFAAWEQHLPGQTAFSASDPVNGVFYAVTVGDALVISLDSVHPSASQSSWLATILAGDEARSATWKIVLFHYPIYPCNEKPPWPEGLPWVGLFEKHGVDVVFTGHSHTFERTCPMLAGQCAAEGGVVYLNTSGGGAPTRDVYPEKTGVVSWGDRTDPYDCGQILEAYRGGWYHFAVFESLGCEAEVKIYGNDAADTKGTPYDVMRISKCE